MTSTILLRIESSELVRLIEDHGAEVTEVDKILLSVEDVFVQVTGIEASVMKQERERPCK